MPRLERGRFVEVDGSPRWEFGLGWWSVEDRPVLVESGRWWVIGILGARPGVGQVGSDRLGPGVVDPAQRAGLDQSSRAPTRYVRPDHRTPARPSPGCSPVPL